MEDGWLFYAAFTFVVVGYLVWFVVVFPILAFARLRHLEADLRALRARVQAGDAPAPAAFAPVSPEPAPVLPRTPAPLPFDLAPPAAPAPKPAPARPHWDLEAVVGANWLAKVGAAAVVLAVAFFLQYAFAAGWIGPEARVIGGLAVAVTLIGLGQYLLPRPRYGRYAQALFSAGMVSFFLSVYAAQQLYGLIGFFPAFAILALGALAVSALSVANHTESVAALCIAGAFAVPVLIHRTGAGGSGSAVQLYAYLTALNLWVALLVRLRPWHSLSVLAFLGTWLLFFVNGGLVQAGWTAEGFASLFLLADLYLGLAAVREVRALGEREATGASNAGVGLVVGGAAAFFVASESALGGAGLLGLPATGYAPLALALVLAATAVAAPPLPNRDAWFRRILAGGAILSILAAAPSGLLGHTVPVAQAPAAFAFIVANLLVFVAVGLQMARREGARTDAALLLGATVVVHAVLAFSALGRIALLGAAAVSLWLPIAACLMLVAAAHRRRTEPADIVSEALGGSALALGGLSALAWTTGGRITDRGALTLFALYVGLGVVWTALGRRASARWRFDLIGAVVQSAASFAAIAYCLGLRSYEGVVGLAVAAVAMASVGAGMGRWLLARRSDDLIGRLVWLGLGLTFASIAIPLQLRAGYVTLAWAAEAAALFWAASVAREPRARWFGLALLAVATIRSITNDLPIAPAGHLGLFLPLLNLRVLAGAAVVAACYGGFYLMGRERERLAEWEKQARVALMLIANGVTLLFVSVDLWWQAGQAWPGSGASAQHLTLSIFWAIYALGAAAAGIWKRVRSVRLFAVGLLYVAILKVFLWDLSGLEQPYRIVSFFGLGVILLATSLLYTRFEDRLHDNDPLHPIGGGTAV